MTVQDAMNEEQKILVLEPDIIINDLETLEPEDALLVTTMSNLFKIEKQLKEKQLDCFYPGSVPNEQPLIENEEIKEESFTSEVHSQLQPLV